MKWSYKKFLIIMFFLVLVSSITSLIMPIVFSFWSLQKRDLSSDIVIFLLFIMILGMLLEVSLTLFREFFAREYNASIFFDLLNKYFRLNYDYIIDQGPANLMERMVVYVNSIYTYMTGDYINILSTIVIMLSILLISALHDVKFFLILFTMIPFNFFGYKILNRKLEEESKKLQEVSASNWQAILSILNQTDYIKQLGNYRYLISKAQPLVNEIYMTMSRVNMTAQSISTLLKGINVIAQTVIMLLVVFRYTENDASSLTVILMSILIPMYFSNLKNISNLSLNKRNLTVSKDFFKNWDQHFEQTGTLKVANIDEIELNLKNLQIKDKTLNCNISGKFSKGDVVWVKGKSGTGKSSLMKLIMKFRIAEGIFINGRDIREYDLLSLREKICYLSQDVPIINASLRNNLFLNLDYDVHTEKKMLDDILLQSILKTKSFDSIIDSKGSNLSGGEKQKISILRAIYNHNEVLILDEITSNIDAESSTLIYNRLLDLKHDKIIFVISHNNDFVEFYNKCLQL